MKINCDLGEGLDAIDAQLMPLVDQASIACGGHAGDDASMRHCIGLAQQHHTEIGIHPSYPDRANFGRLSLTLAHTELTASLRQQMQHFLEICSREGARARYVKAHGALYNDLSSDTALLARFFQLVADLNRKRATQDALAVMVSARLRTDVTCALAERYNLDLLFEAFADRSYQDDGRLMARGQANAVFTDPGAIVSQYRELSEKQGVTTGTGRWLALNADTICVHGDNPAVPEAINRITKLK